MKFDSKVRECISALCLGEHSLATLSDAGLTAATHVDLENKGWYISQAMHGLNQIKLMACEIKRLLSSLLAASTGTGLENR